MYNPHKTISAGEYGIKICFTDNYKHTFKKYESTIDLSKIQIEGNARYQEFEKNVFNPVQEKLYAQVVYGFAAYDQKAIETMSPKTKRFIKVRYTKAQQLINRCKQEILNKSVNLFFVSLFPKSKFAREIASTEGFDKDYLCTFSLKELGLSKIKIAEHLIENYLLPKHFFKIKA